MNPTLTIKLNKSEEERLSRLALNYGLSLPEFSRKILIQLSNSFPSETWEEYKNPKALKASLNRALKDFTAGRVQTQL